MVGAQQLVTRRNNVSPGRVVGALDVFTEIFDRRFRLFQQMDGSIGHFTQVMRRDIRRHTHRNTGSTIEQYHWQTCGQQDRLLHGAIEIGCPVDRPLAQFRQQHFRKSRQARFGVAHGSKGFGIVLSAPVTLPVDQRVAERERLCHVYHGFVAGRITVRVEFAQHIADGACGFLELGARRQPELGHGIDNPPLDRLEPVADMRQGAVENDIHGIVQVGLFGKGM